MTMVPSTPTAWVISATRGSSGKVAVVVVNERRCGATSMVEFGLRASSVRSRPNAAGTSRNILSSTGNLLRRPAAADGSRNGDLPHP